jgi:hypothetical protein
MLKRKLLFPIILATAAGAPYAVMENDWSNAAKEKLQGLWPDGDSAERPSVTFEPIGDVDVPIGNLGVGQPEYKSEFTIGRHAENPRPGVHASLAGPPVSNLAEVMRFDVSPTWVTSRWPRVTTTLAESGMEGLRVPLVTGTKVDDLAGSLTYYFDRNHRVQRLTFDGYTGDDRRLLALAARYYGVRQEPTLDASMYVARWNGRPTSIVRVTRAPIISADSPNSQLHVMMELNRPSAYYGLSPQFVQMLRRDRHSQRW